MNEEFREKLIQEVLKKQEEIFVSKDKMDIDKIEPYSWMDENMKEVLEQSLPQDQMEKLDECARANFAGRNTMTKAIIEALNKSKDKK